VIHLFRMAETPAPNDANARTALLQNAGLGVALALATLFAYWPALQGGLIIDDLDHITRPEWRSLTGLARIWTDVGITSQYFPLLHTAFWIEYHLWQDAVLGYHLVNVLQHVLSAYFVVAVMRRLQIPGGWFAGFVFAVHPVCVESVAWISEQKNTLSTLLYLAAAYTYLGFDRNRRVSRYWVAFGLFVLALLTKSVTATLAPALLVVFWWERGRIEWRRDVRPLVPWLLVGATLGLFTAWYERVYAHAQGASFALGLLERILIAGRDLVFYARTLVWPTDLMFINPRWEVDPGAAWQYAFPAAVLVIAVGLVWLARRRRAPLAAFLIYVGTLAPTLGFLNINWFNYSYVADHFQYLASLGLIVPAAAGLTGIFQRVLAARVRLASTVASAMLLAVLGVLTWRQSGHYRDAETLYRHTIAQNPAAWIAHHNLGVILLERPDGLDEAIDSFLTVLTLKPNHLRALNGLGHAFSRIPGRLPDAILAYEASLRLKPDDPQVITQLAYALAQTPGRETEALSAFRRAVQLDALAWQARVGLAQLFAATPGRLDDAISEYRAAIQLQPYLARLHFDLGGLLAVAGRTTEAMAAYENTLRLEPENAGAHFNLGSLLTDEPGRLSEAVRHLEAALRLTPDDPAVHNNLGIALLEMPGQRDEAIARFQTVLRLAPDSAEAHFNLGRAMLMAPADERAALRQFEAAVRLRPSWEAAHNAVAQLRARIR